MCGHVSKIHILKYVQWEITLNKKKSNQYKRHEMSIESIVLQRDLFSEVSRKYWCVGKNSECITEQFSSAGAAETQHWQRKQTKKRKDDKCYFPHSIVLGKASLERLKQSNDVRMWVHLCFCDSSGSWIVVVICACWVNMHCRNCRHLFFSLLFFSRWYAFSRFSAPYLHLLSFDNKTNRPSLKLQLTFDLSCQLSPGDPVRDSRVQ